MARIAGQRDESTLRFMADQVRMARELKEGGNVPLLGELNVLLYGTAHAPVREEWRKIRWSESEEYWVSALGHFAVWRERPARIWERNGYKQAVLYRDGRKTPCAIHVLVARLFCTWTVGDRVVRHLNGNRSDNHANNLKPGSYAENLQDRRNASRGLVRNPSPPAIELWKLSDQCAGASISNLGQVRLGWWVAFNTSGYSYRGGAKKHVGVTFAWEGKKHTELLHRLVYEAFNGPLPSNIIIRHLNDDPHDNRLKNLAEGTAADNAEDSMRNGRLRLGQNHPNAKYSDDQRGTFITLVADGTAIAEAARRAGIKPSTGYQIVNRMRKGLPVAYTFNGL